MININDSHINPELTFKRLVYLHMQQLTNFPYIEKDFDALTDYELLCLVVKYLNDVIKNSNDQNDSITNLYNAFLALQDYMNNSVQELEDAWNDKTDELETAFNQLHDYVQNYFANLDVQDEINNKLDQMLEDGVLEQIIEQFIQSTALWCFDTVADMKLATNFTNGSYAKTMGYNSLSDGGESNYKIRTKTNEDIPDEKLIISLYDDNLVAELIVYDTINIKQLGAYGDGVHDDFNSFNTFANSNIKKLIIPYGTYNLSDMVTFTNKELIGIGQPTLEYVSQTTEGEHYIKFYNYFKVENITFNQKVHNTNVVGVFDCSFSTFKNCKFIADGYKCGSELDLYTNNHDILIDNCYFKLKSYDSNNVIQEGGIWIREHIADKESYNINFNNCIISHDSKDEIIASWNWVGTVHDVVFNNCKLIGESTNTAPWFITFNTENSSINNCYIENKRTSNFSGMFKHNENITYKNITINNCFIKQYSNMTNGFSTFKVTFNNCLIENYTTKEDLDGKAIYNNCTFNLKQPSFNGGNFYYCKFKGDGSTSTGNVISLNGPTNLYIIGCLFENYIFTDGMFIYVYNNCDNIIIKDTLFNIDISTLTYYLFGNKDIQNLQIINSNIEKGIYITGTVTGVISNNTTNRSITAFSNVKVNNNFNIKA